MEAAAADPPLLVAGVLLAIAVAVTLVWPVTDLIAAHDVGPVITGLARAEWLPELRLPDDDDYDFRPRPLRERVRRPSETPLSTGGRDQQKVATDVQAALTVVG